jgi:hypothetical protein
MMVINSVWQWPVMVIGGLAALAPIAIVISGARIQRIPWADTAIAASLPTALVCVMVLWGLDLFSSTSVSTRPVVAIAFGVGWAASVLLVLLPAVLIVGSIRKRKGWDASISGRPPALGGKLGGKLGGTLGGGGKHSPK